MIIAGVNTQNLIRYMQQYTQQIMFGVGGVIVIVGCLYGYSMYQSWQEQAAQRIYAACVQEVHRAQQDSALWPNAELAAETAYYQYSGTAWSVYFILLRAHILAYQNKQEEAVALYEQGLMKLKSTSPLYHEYALAAALVKIDSSDPLHQEQGLKSLQTLAYNHDNVQRDHALYELASYYDAHDDHQQAQSVWQQLITAFPAQDLGMSLWATLAKEKVAEHA